MQTVVVDAHTHLLPGRIAKKIRAFFDEHLPGQLRYELDNQSTLDALASEGVRTVWNLPYAHRSDIARQLNRDMIGLSQFFADHVVEVIPGCTVHPDDEDPVRDLNEAVANGARVLKLHCSVGGYEADDPRLSAVLSRAGHHGVPVVIHAGHAISGSTRADELAPIGNAASQNPATTLILAHFGHHAFEGATQLLDKHPNVVADLTPVVMDPVPLTREIAEKYRERILFGSDAPNTGHRVSDLLDGLRGLGLASNTHDKIVSGNAIRLLQS